MTEMAGAERRTLGRVLGATIIVAALVTSAWSWWLTYHHPRTDDAAVRANIVGIAPHVGGPIVDLRVVDNQQVRQGDLLFVVDPRPYQAKLDASQAALSLTQSEVGAQRDAIAAAQAELARRSAEVQYADDYLRRVEPLLKPGYVTVDKVDEARTKLLSAKASRDSARQERGRAEKLLAQVGELNARLQASEAALETAKLELDYCYVHAPFDAYVTNLNITVGEYAREGQQVFALVDNRTWYVLANFQETFMANIRPGMTAEVFLLSYPGYPVHGTVQGIGWAVLQPDGSSGGVLPRIERTLDWVRLAQRFPVRVQLEPPSAARPYRMGATAVVTIRGEAPTASGQGPP
jgi:multidrug resistance efflux pump